MPDIDSTQLTKRVNVARLAAACADRLKEETNGTMPETTRNWWMGEFIVLILKNSDEALH
jgi:hypothetical protein